MEGKLTFREDGTFTIVQFTDVHWRNGDKGEARTRDLMEQVIREERPDLIVYTGDLIHGPRCADPIRAIRESVDAAVRSGIPWAAVFGNHDDEGGATRGELMAALRQLPGCVAQAGPAGVDGVGNYAVRLEAGGGEGSGRGEAGGGSGAVLYFLDSGGMSGHAVIQGYDWIRPSQIEWYREQSLALARENGGRPLPALAFFHIPLPEYREVWQTAACLGGCREKIHCPPVNSGLFAAMAERGDVMGTFCGHDHLNDFEGQLLWIRLVYGRSSGYTGYGRSGFKRGARVIRLREGEREFATWIRLHGGRIARQRLHHPWLTRLSERLRRWF